MTCDPHWIDSVVWFFCGILFVVLAAITADRLGVLDNVADHLLEKTRNQLRETKADLKMARSEIERLRQEKSNAQ